MYFVYILWRKVFGGGANEKIFDRSCSVDVAHIYPPVMGQRRTLNIGRSAHFSLH